MAKSSQRRIGDFTIVGELAGKGGQGRIFSARCDRDGAFPGLQEGQIVALKAMPVRGDDPAKVYRRLKRRTDALSAAVHPGIVRYWGCFAKEGGIGEDLNVVVMDLLRGETLEERLKREPLGLDAAEALRIVRTCLEALVCAAGHGIVHRDVKPSNVFLCEDGGVKLIDFEIAQAETAAQTTTESGAMQGTYDYMAPDFHPDFRPDPKFRGDACSDVFSLSVLFHEALTGRRPYPSRDGRAGDQSMMDFFRRWSRTETKDPSRMVKIDALRVHALRHVGKFLAKGLSPERGGRYRTYAEMLEALSAVSVRELRGARDSYRLSVCVGKGGFGAVYKAWRASDGTPVAVKFLTRADADGRFWREARTLGRFHDGRIVSFVESFAVGHETRMPVLVMEFLPGMPGSSLKDRLSSDACREGVPAAEAVAAFVRYAEGLAVLHAGGVFHRDVKPANLYLPAGAPERACLMDLGIVRTDDTQTSGGLPGTPDYMAPELARSATRGDARSDVFSLGLCFYEALTGSPAYPRLPRGPDAYPAWFERARSGEKPDLSALDWYPEARKAIAKLANPEPVERPSSASRAAAILRALPVRERPRPVQDPDPETSGVDGDGTSIFDGETTEEPPEPEVRGGPEPEPKPEPVTQPESGQSPVPPGEPGPEAAETSAPTVVPTVLAPVAPEPEKPDVPTESQVVDPTVAPTVVPTVAPTVVPTVAPTAVPTVAPTVAPTVSGEEPPEPVSPRGGDSTDRKAGPAVREIRRKSVIPAVAVVAVLVLVGIAAVKYGDRIVTAVQGQVQRWEEAAEKRKAEEERLEKEKRLAAIAKAETNLGSSIDAVLKRIDSEKKAIKTADSNALDRIARSISSLSKDAAKAFDEAKAVDGVDTGKVFRANNDAFIDATNDVSSNIVNRLKALAESAEEHSRNAKARLEADARLAEEKRLAAIAKAETNLVSTIDDVLKQIRIEKEAIKTADSNSLDRIALSISSLSKDAAKAFGAANAVDGVATGKVFRAKTGEFADATNDVPSAIDYRRKKLAKDAADRIKDEIEKRLAAIAKAETNLGSSIDAVLKRIDSEKEAIKTADSNALDRIALLISSLSTAADEAFHEANAVDGVSTGKVFRAKNDAFIDATNNVSSVIAGLRDGLAVEAQRKRRAEEAAEKSRQKEYDKLSESVLPVPEVPSLGKIDSREKHKSAVEQFTKAKSECDRSAGSCKKAGDEIDAQLLRPDSELPGNWKSKYRELQKTLKQRLDDAEANGKSAAESLEALKKPHRIVFRNNSGIPLNLSVSNRDPISVPNGEAAFKFDPWTGDVEYRWSVVNFPDDYSKSAGVGTVPVRAAGESSTIDLPRAADLGLKKEPCVTVENKGKIDALVSVKPNFDQVLIRSGESKDFNIPPRKSIEVVAKSPEDSPVAQFVPQVSKSVGALKREDRRTVEFELEVDAGKVDFSNASELSDPIALVDEVKSVLAPDNLRAIAGNALTGATNINRDLYHIEQPSDDMWGAVSDFGYIPDVLLQLEVALRLDPDSSEAKKWAGHAKASIENFQHLRDYFVKKHPELRSQWASFTDACDAAGVGR